ncbi:hypothetical protein [Xenorhabdus bovienii]|uniref:hypothetical protein n=1 Tax=Xenorhabdus bovienii TaxID=40576 RepID=UPI00237C79FD|nr:hypothetical protein [Xenorhabdus bovienii]MDE1482494.1 hypothetical protein [Xenorhabdus bovienii]MDE9441578.1 hypothetical protein [Xenorhabdus bovienii]
MNASQPLSLWHQPAHVTDVLIYACQSTRREGGALASVCTDHQLATTFTPEGNPVGWVQRPARLC